MVIAVLTGVEVMMEDASCNSSAMMYSARCFRCFLRKSRVKRRETAFFAVSVHHLLQFGRRLNCNKYRGSRFPDSINEKTVSDIGIILNPCNHIGMFLHLRGTNLSCQYQAHVLFPQGKHIREIFHGHQFQIQNPEKFI